MSAIVIVWLRRAFDLVCASAGLVLLAFLGPWMLLTAATSHVPDRHELTRLDGITAACRPVLGGIRLLIKGYESEFQSQLDSCTEADVDLARATHVALNVMPGDLKRMRPHAAISAFGLEVEDRVVHTIGSDLRTARLDQAILTATGIAGTGVLLWLGWAVATNRRGLRRLLLGESAGGAE
jgi:hypothetical protein